MCIMPFQRAFYTLQLRWLFWLRKTIITGFSAQRERQEFERILHEQERKIRHEENAKTEKLVEMKNHSHQLRAQIQNRERERIEERKTFFEESDQLTTEQEEHERKIQKVIFKF